MKKVISFILLCTVFTQCKSYRMNSKANKITQGKLVFKTESLYGDKENNTKTLREINLYFKDYIKKDTTLIDFIEHGKKNGIDLDSIKSLMIHVNNENKAHKPKKIIYFKGNTVKVFRTVKIGRNVKISNHFQRIELDKKVIINKARSDTTYVGEINKFPFYDEALNRMSKYEIDKKDTKKILGFNCYKVRIKYSMKNVFKEQITSHVEMYVTEEIDLPKNTILLGHKIDEPFFPLEIITYTSDYPNLKEKLVLVEFSHEANDREEIKYY